ncbi:MAG TPA: dienelactone hydrolase family protein [Candidatus Angelobacter sp.]|nr:dienelactone hydrolase family protein [Candidatus Angelobacter sp.]
MSAAQSFPQTPEGFTATTFTHEGKSKPLYRAGSGPAVIIMSEIPGITLEVARFARYVVQSKFSVYMPELVGQAMRPVSVPYALGQMFRVCISSEFRVFAAHRSSPIVDWLRALANHAHQEQGGKGVGAVGMCLTGNFALAMMLDAPLLAPVLSQPSVPFMKKDGLHASDAEIAAAKERVAKDGARILGLRFTSDSMCRKERFQQLRETFGDAFESIELDPSSANPKGPGPPHSVLTNHLIDEAGQPTRQALDRVLVFLHEQLD